MSKKVLNIQPVINELKGQSAFFRRDPEPQETATESVTEAPAEGKSVQKEKSKGVFVLSLSCKKGMQQDLLEDK